MSSLSPSHNLFEFKKSEQSEDQRVWPKELLLWVNVLGLPLVAIVFAGVMVYALNDSMKSVLVMGVALFIIGWLQIVVRYIEPKIFPPDEWETVNLRHVRKLNSTNK